MAHEISIRKDGKAEMAFVGETPWHGLGQSVTKGASIGVWAKEAGMDWQAEEGTPMVSVYSADGGHRHPLCFPDHKALWRSDTKEPIAIVGAGYNVVQPADVLEFFRDMTESGGWHIHTAGVLRGGRKLWAMATNNQQGNVSKKGDTIINNLLLATSLDGSMKTMVVDTAVRVVCANTLALAMQDNRGVVGISHRSVFDAVAVKKALGLAENTFEKFMTTARELADTPINLEQATDVLRQVFNPKPVKVDTSWMGKIADIGKPRIDDETRVMAAVLDLFTGDGKGADLKTSKGTRWGLLNAVTEHIDHASGRTDDTRLDSAWFGRGAALKARTLELLTA